MSKHENEEYGGEAQRDDKWAADTLSNVFHSAEAGLTEKDLEALGAVEAYLREDDEDLEAFEEKMDELNQGLLEAYAAGFAKAKEVYDIENGGTDARSLMKSDSVSESHFYYWDGRTKPLEFWLREQFGLAPEDDDWPHFGTSPGLGGDNDE